MALFGSKKQKGKQSDGTLALICDIGTARVAGAIVLLAEDKSPEVLYQTSAEMVFQRELDYQRFTQSMLTSLDTVLMDISQKGMSHIHIAKGANMARDIGHVLCTYASPWHLSQIRHVTYTENNKAFTATDKLLRALTKKEQGKILVEEISEHEKEAGAAMDLVEQQITGITLDGYAVSDPIGKETRELGFSMSATFMARALKHAVERRLRKHVQTEILHHSFGFVGFTALRDMFDELRDYILVDVTGEITDAHLITDHILRDVVSFPYGSRSIIRHVSKKKDTDIELARTMVRNYVREHAQDDVVASGVGEAVEQWTTSCVTAFETMQDIAPLPEYMLCVVDERLGPLFRGALHDVQTHIKSLPDDKEKIQVLSAGSLVPFVTFRDTITHDPFVALETHFAQRRFVQ